MDIFFVFKKTGDKFIKKGLVEEWKISENLWKMDNLLKIFAYKAVYIKIYYQLNRENTKRKKYHSWNFKNEISLRRWEFIKERWKITHIYTKNKIYHEFKKINLKDDGT